MGSSTRFWNLSRPVSGPVSKMLEPVQLDLGPVPKILDPAGPGLGPAKLDRVPGLLTPTNIGL